MVKLFIPLTLIALTFISDLYIFHRFFNTTSLWKWMWWLPFVVVLGFLAKFVFFHNGLAEEYNTTNFFLLTLGLFCIPNMLFALFCPIPKVGPYIGGAFAACILYIVIYGITIGFCQEKVSCITYENASVPKAFDGYKVVVFSDTHSGVFRGPYSDLLKSSIETINRENPDLVCFVGDIENFTPDELEPHKAAFSSIKAKDGVYAIMGNHDYSTYLNKTVREKALLVQKTRDMMKSFGWNLLVDTHAAIHRDNDSIIVIGEENWGLPPFPQYGKIKTAVSGVSSDDFTIMLSHDPNAWRAHILPVFRPNITFSGHTHGSQFSLFGWSPASNIYREWGGRFDDESSMLYVTTGLGGNFPFRFGMPREIVVVTLKTSN